MGLTAREPGPRGIDRVAGVGHEDDVARVDECERDVRRPFLGPDQGQDLGGRLQGHAEALGVPAGGRLAEREEAFVVRVTVVPWLAGCPRQRVDDVGRRRQVRVADAEIDQVHASCPHLLLLAVDLGKQIRGQALEAVR